LAHNAIETPEAAEGMTASALLLQTPKINPYFLTAPLDRSDGSLFYKRYTHTL
jgi:hypothetical protein